MRNVRYNKYFVECIATEFQLQRRTYLAFNMLVVNNEPSELRMCNYIRIYIINKLTNYT